MKFVVVLLVIGVIWLGSSHCGKVNNPQIRISSIQSVGHGKALFAKKQSDNSLIFDTPLVKNQDRTYKNIDTGTQSVNLVMSNRNGPADLQLSIEKMELLYFDKEYFENGSFARADLFNDTQDIGEAVLIQRKDFPKSPKMMIDATLSLFRTGTNIWFAAIESKRQPLCDFIKTNSRAKYVMKFTNIDVNKTCPTPQGKWLLTELYYPVFLSHDGFPYPSLWKANVDIYIGEKPILRIQAQYEYNKAETK